MIQLMMFNARFVALFLCFGTIFHYAVAIESPQSIRLDLGVGGEYGEISVIASQFYERELYYDPIQATFKGNQKYSDRLTLLVNPSIKKQRTAEHKALLKRLDNVRTTNLSDFERLQYHCLKYELEQSLASAEFPTHLLPINQLDNLPVKLAQIATSKDVQKFNTEEEYWRYLKRVQQLPVWLAHAETNLNEGIRQRVVLPKVIVERVLSQLSRLTDPAVIDHPYYSPMLRMPQGIPKNSADRIKKDSEFILKQKVIPALSSFKNYLQNQYLPFSSDSAGYHSHPNGTSWYQQKIKSATTLELTADEIHLLGLKEIARIQTEFSKLKSKFEFAGPTVDLPKWISNQTWSRPFSTEEEIFDEYKKIQVTVQNNLSKVFKKIPDFPLEVRPEPLITRDTASNHYTSPAKDGSRPGIFWAVIRDPKAYSKAGMLSLYLHEGAPGHHFHYGIMQGLEIFEFRKNIYLPAFGEGWALYAETLGAEMGLYEKDDLSYFGHLNAELWRASRLVVDTGIHAKKWTREQGISFLMNTLGFSRDAATQEVERYMVWPGQALAYKVGALKIQSLRNFAATELKDKFDLSQFNDTVLSDGSVPLPILEEKIKRWINRNK